MEKSDVTKATDSNKGKAIELAIQTIEKQFGKGSIMRLGNDENLVANDIPVVPTGSLGLDLALGIGGLPRGRIVEVYGPEASGKTTLHYLTAAQRKAWMDKLRPIDKTVEGRVGKKVIAAGETIEEALGSPPLPVTPLTTLNASSGCILMLPFDFRRFGARRLTESVPAERSMLLLLLWTAAGAPAACRLTANVPLPE